VTGQRVAVTGADGQLGRQLVATFRRSGWDVLGAGRDRLDITSLASLRELTDWRPQVVINAAAWTDVDGCARDPERARRVNGEAAGSVAEAAGRSGALAVQLSTNEVFDGEADEPYTEGSAPHPLNPYGASKLMGEQAVATANPDHLIARTAWIFGPGGRNFPSKIIEIARRQAAMGEPVRVVADEFGNPTWAPDLAEGLLRAVQLHLDGVLGSGILHMAGEPSASRFTWAEAILAGLPEVELQPIAMADYPRPSRVPARAVLAVGRGAALGIAPSDWRAATATYAAELLAAGVPG
jgi:dTDP-4-dehydrorhamnose reductase